MTTSTLLLLVMQLLVVYFTITAVSGNFYQQFDITWGNGRAKVVNNGELVTLSLDRDSGSGFQTKQQYLFGKLSMQLKLVSGNSAGSVTSYYLSSKGTSWDEIDFEFLGNLSGDPYTVHTNVITQGKRDREQQFHLWFDPTLDFHTYTILWNPLTILFLIDGTPIRQFKNMKSKGIPFPEKQAMRMYSSVWDGEEWATRGGLIKTDWNFAPFTASFRNFSTQACVWNGASSSCKNRFSSYKWLKEELEPTSVERLKWVQNNYMIYNYCADTKRFPQGLPPECAFHL